MLLELRAIGIQQPCAVGRLTGSTRDHRHDEEGDRESGSYRSSHYLHPGTRKDPMRLEYLGLSFLK